MAGFLPALPISVDDETANQAWTTTMGLAERFALSAYDAAYLDLTQRHRLPLTPLDDDLRAAALALGLTVLEVDQQRKLTGAGPASVLRLTH